VTKFKLKIESGRLTPLDGARTSKLSLQTRDYVDALVGKVIINCSPMSCDIQKFPPRCKTLDCTLSSPDCSDFEIACGTVDVKAPKLI
jgi:hypothetical protein